MPVEPIFTLTLLSNLFVAIANSLQKIKGTSKQRFGKDLIALLDILEDAEKKTITLIDELEIFINQPDEANYKIIYESGSNGVQVVHDASESYTRFLSWIDNHSEWKNAIEILAPDDLRKALRMIEDIEIASISIFGRLVLMLDTLKYELKKEEDTIRLTALKKRLSDLKPDLKQLVLALKQFLSELRRTEKIMREFGRNNLTIEDLF